MSNLSSDTHNITYIPFHNDTWRHQASPASIVSPPCFYTFLIASIDSINPKNNNKENSSNVSTLKIKYFYKTQLFTIYELGLEQKLSLSIDYFTTKFSQFPAENTSFVSIFSCSIKHRITFELCVTIKSFHTTFN